MNIQRFAPWLLLFPYIAPQSAAQEKWAIADTPSIVIENDAPGRAPLGRLVGARRLPSGEIIVADASAVELRLFDARGRFIRVITRQGRGPGELTNIVSLVRTDRAIVAIGGLDFVSVGLDATAPTRHALPNIGGPPSGSILGVFNAERILLGEARFRRLTPPSRVIRDTT